MFNAQGFGDYTLSAGGSQTVSIRQNVLTHILVKTALTDLIVEADFYGTNNTKLIESCNILYLQDVAYPDRRFMQGNLANYFQIPIGHIHLNKDVIEVTFSSATGGAISVVVGEAFRSNDYLIRHSVSSGSSKVYNDLRVAKKLLADATGDIKVFTSDKKSVFSSNEANCIGASYIPTNSATMGAFIINPKPLQSSTTIEYTDTSKNVYYSQYIFDENLVNYSIKANQQEYAKVVSEQSKLPVVKKLQNAE